MAVPEQTPAPAIMTTPPPLSHVGPELTSAASLVAAKWRPDLLQPTFEQMASPGRNRLVPWAAIGQLSAAVARQRTGVSLWPQAFTHDVPFPLWSYRVSYKKGFRATPRRSRRKRMEKIRSDSSGNGEVTKPSLIPRTKSSRSSRLIGLPQRGSRVSGATNHETRTRYSSLAFEHTNKKSK